MAISCDPTTLVEEAKCFKCIPRDMMKPVELYILANAAGFPTTAAGVASLVSAAKCFKCVPREMQEPLAEYLLAQIAGCT